MATGRTVSATELTKKDLEALKICSDISENLANLIDDKEKKEDFIKKYGRVHLSRDAGLGRAGAKLQRDALCTRGRTDKAPFSNRNLRWHPLVIAMETPNFAKEIEEIALDDKTLVFIIEGDIWYPKDVHRLNDVYCAPFDKWYEIRDELNRWKDKDWSNNSCCIPAMEYSLLEKSVETFAILGIAVVGNYYGVDPQRAYDDILDVFNKYHFALSTDYPKREEVFETILCPLCLSLLNSPPGNLELKDRERIFQPPWRRSKREEGEAESLQLFHKEPLKESEILHTAKLARYGHRWCNVAMADHSVGETLEFMQAVVEAHEKRKKSGRVV